MQTNYHNLVSQSVYGPVESRRYGKTLGINLLPSDSKLCQFDCVYCQLGRNEPHTRSLSFPDRNDVTRALNRFLQKNSNQHFDALVVSGNGEPTLNPHFAAITKALSKTKTQGSRLPLILFTNGLKLRHTAVTNALKHFDEVCLKWDLHPEHSNQYKHNWDESDFKFLKNQKNIVLQSCLFHAQGNEEMQHVSSWLQGILKIQPQRLDLYTLSRKTPDPKLKPWEASELEALKSTLHDHTDIPIRLN